MVETNLIFISMKKVIFGLIATVFIGSFAFATNVKTSEIDVLSNKISKNITVNFDDLNKLNFNELANCTVTIKKKNTDGTWSEYQITVHDTTCDKLVKSIISSL